MCNHLLDQLPSDQESFITFLPFISIAGCKKNIECTVLTAQFSNDKQKSCFLPENLDQLRNLNLGFEPTLSLYVDIYSS